MDIAKTIAGIVVAGYAAMVLLLYLLQDRLLFFPTRDVFATPMQRSLRYEDVAIVTSDKIHLHGWWVPSPSPRATILFLHGNGGNVAHTIEAIESFARIGFNVLSFDYRGYGRSDGAPDGDGLVEDAEAAWRYLTTARGIDPANIIVVGRSLGGGLASLLAVRHHPAGLVLESTYSSIPDRAAEQFPFLPARHLVRVKYDNRRNLASVRCPVLIVHSKDDEIIPFHHATRLFDAAHESRELVAIAHGHNDGFALSGGAYVDAIDRFATRCAAASSVQ